MYPFSPSHVLGLTDIEEVTDAFLALLRMPAPGVEGVDDLEGAVLDCFCRYLTSRSRSPETRSAYLEKAAKLVEVFLRKLYALRNSGQMISSYRHAVCAVGGCMEPPLAQKSGRIQPTEEEKHEDLDRRITHDAILCDAYYFRNVASHEAHILNTAEEDRYWRSVVGAFLLTASKHIDLVPAVVDRLALKGRVDAWLRNYLGRMQVRFDDTKWGRQYYVDLASEKGGSLQRHVKSFLDDPDNRLLVITGRVGAGKSTLLERLVTQLSGRALRLLDEGADDLQIPVHMELKRFTRERTLRRRLYRELDRNHELGLRRSANAWPGKIPRSDFVICLDGLDETRPGDLSNVVSQIDDLCCDYDNVRVIVASRPHAVPPHWRDRVVPLAPLSRDEVLAYFGDPERLNLIAPSVQQLLQQKPDLVETLQDPLMAEAACEYWTRYDVPGTDGELDPETEAEALCEGPLLEHLFERLFDHHLGRVDSSYDPENVKPLLWHVLEDLASSADGERLVSYELVVYTLRCPDGQPIRLEDLTDMGVLVAEQGEYRFRNDTAKAYFAARKLRSVTREESGIAKARSIIRRADVFWNRCIQMLTEIGSGETGAALQNHLAALA